MYKCYSKNGKELVFKNHVDYKDALSAGATTTLPKQNDNQIKNKPKQKEG